MFTRGTRVLTHPHIMFFFFEIAIGCHEIFGTPDVIQADKPASERWPWLGATKVFLRFWLPITSGCPYI